MKTQASPDSHSQRRAHTRRFMIADCIQVAAATQNFAILEFFSGMDAWHELYDIDLTCRDGYFSIPDRPGLGVELDESKFAEYPYESIPTDVKYNKDGSVLEV